MVNTKKFSEFDAANINATNKTVGLSGGVNAIFDDPITWTTAGRPSTPTNGQLGYNTDIQQYEYWDAVSLQWLALSSGDSGTVTQVNTGTGLTGGPITDTGTISFAAIAAMSLWANVTASAAVPTVIPTSTFLLTSNNLSDVPNKATARTNLGLQIGVNVEAWNAQLDQIAAGTWPGANSITTLGTIAFGTWQSTAIGAIYGGTGQTTYTLGDTLYSSAANTLSKLAGNITTTKQYLSQTGTGAVSAAPLWATIDGGDITGAALSKVDDTNVTLTLGGTPLTALLRATSLTLGWTGQLSMARGGTNANLTAANGAVLYSTATALALLAPGTSGQLFQSGGVGAPNWTTAKYPSAAGASGNVLRSNGTDWVSSADSPGALTQNHIYVGDASNVAQDVAMSGDATIISSGALTIANNAVSNAKLAQMPTLTIKGNNTGGTANALDLTVAQVNTMLGVGNVTITDDTTTNATMYPTWVTANTGTLPLKVTSTKLSFNPSSGQLTLLGALKSVTSILDANGNTQLGFTATASAVNYISITNGATGQIPSILVEGTDTNINLLLQAKGTGAASLYSSGVQILRANYNSASDVNYINAISSATGNAPTLIAAGTDTNITLNLKGKGTGGAAVLGTSTNDNAASGYVGEFVSSTVTAGSPVSITSATPKNLTSISLTAGDWDVWGNISFRGSAVALSVAIAGINTVSNTAPAEQLYSGTDSVLCSYIGITAPSQRISISATTTIYIVGNAVFGSGTASMSGGLYARRVR